MRTTQSWRIRTVPRVQVRRRTTSARPSPVGIRSSSTTSPSAVVNVVSSSAVPSTYLRLVDSTSSAGASSQRPWSSVPSSAAKQAGESKRGRHSQSIEPSLPTSAAVPRSPMRA